MKKLFISLLALTASVGLVFAQGGAFPNYPIQGGAAYCSSTTNNVCTNTVPAGPTTVTGHEMLPADTGNSSGAGPANVLFPAQILGTLPITWVNVTTSAPTPVSASNIQGGIFYIISAGAITSAQITLPINAYDQQQFLLSANHTITTLTVTAPAGDTMGASAAPTVLTATTTAAFGYKWIYHKATKVWQRFQ